MYLIQEMMFGLWVTIDASDDYEFARALLAKIKECHPDPADNDDTDILTRYRIFRDNSEPLQTAGDFPTV